MADHGLNRATAEPSAIACTLVPMLRHYLDTASTSPLRPIARLAMQQSLDVPAATSGQSHLEGRTVRHQLELARQSVASFLGAQPDHVTFTSSATESITTAIWSQAERTPGTVIFSAAEHAAVRRTAERTAHRMVSVDQTGRVDPAAIADAIDAERAASRPVSMVVCQLGNHEVGAIQPIEVVSAICQQRDVALLVDGAQAIGRVPVDFAASGASFLAVSGHKLGGPAGIGALVTKQELDVDPLLVGEANEHGKRAGLENTVGAVGLGAVCAELTDTWLDEASAARRATDRLREVIEPIEGVEILGPSTADQRLPHLISLAIADIEPDRIARALDRAGIAAHANPSNALGGDSLRLSVGWHTTEADIDAARRAIPEAIQTLRALSP